MITSLSLLFCIAFVSPVYLTLSFFHHCVIIFTNNTVIIQCHAKTTYTGNPFVVHDGGSSMVVLGLIL